MFVPATQLYQKTWAEPALPGRESGKPLQQGGPALPEDSVSGVVSDLIIVNVKYPQHHNQYQLGA